MTRLMKIGVYLLLSVWTCALSLSVLHSQTAEDSLLRRFELGEVLISSDKSLVIARSGGLTQGQMADLNKLDVAGALGYLPGVTLANIGARNEAVVYVRGFDLRQVPVFIDGIPVYTPFDGYVDLGRFLSGDLAQISVEKGFSSVLYGPNAMGGAINLVSRKPQGKREIDGYLGWLSGESYRYALNVGMRQKKFYFQGGVTGLERRYYPMSASFVGTTTEDGGRRENSYRSDHKVNVKVAFTPNDTDEYALTYVRQDGEKGNPPYTGTDPRIRARYWRWPAWDKESLYFIANKSVSTGHVLKVRAYFDRFVNTLFSYDDATYTTQNRPFAFQSFYDAYTFGGNAEWAVKTYRRHDIKVAGYFKQDVHRENNRNEPRRTMADQTYSLAVEDGILLAEKWRASAGLSLNWRNSLRAQHYIPNATPPISEFPTNHNQAANAQVGVWYLPAERHRLRASVARKTRFPTLKDRYSYRLGQAIPNPDLKPEVAYHYELNYSGVFWKKKMPVEIALFRSDIASAIQRVDSVQNNLFQLQNTGRARFIGAEVAVQQYLSNFIEVGINYAFIQRKSLDRPQIQFTDVPEHQLQALLKVRATRYAEVIGTFEAHSWRYSTSYGTKADAFAVANLAIRVYLLPSLGIHLGVNNLWDANYALIEGFPEEGRNYFASLLFRVN